MRRRIAAPARGKRRLPQAAADDQEAGEEPVEDDSEEGSGGDSDDSSGVSELTEKLPDLDFNISGEAYVLPAKPPPPADPLHRLHTFKAIYGQRIHGEDAADLKRRHDCYVAVRRLLDDEVTRIQHSTLADVCSALVKFITEIDVDDPEEDTIPTAILLTGYNLGDRVSMHDEIRGEIEKLGPLARVEPQHCTTLKKVVKHLVTTFIGPNAKEVTQKQWKLAKLAEWRNALPEAKRPARLMVFFDEVQSCNPTVLQDLIEVSRMHQHDLHLLFVISLHSSAQALREILPRSKMEHLRIEPFKLEPSVQLLKRIVSEVLVSGLLPVRFSGAVLREINCNFHTWNLSVWRYVRCIQLLILDFFSQPLSVYCMPPATHPITPTPLHVRYARTSFESVARMSEKELTEKWPALIAALREYHARFPHVFRIYQSLVARPSEPSTLEHNVYAMCFLTGKEHALARSQQLPPALYQVWPDANDVRIYNQRTPFDLAVLVKLTDSWLGALDSLPSDDPLKQSMHASLTAIREQLTEELRNPQVVQAQAKAAATNPSARLARGQALLESVGATEIGVARASPARRALREWLMRLFDEHLAAPDAYPLYEIFFNSNLALLNVLYPEMERVLEAGLATPALLLGCVCCKSHELGPSLPDVCVAFQLMRRERTRELNLYDWLESFREVVAARKETEQQEQARFFNALDSLQLLGYVRQGKTRKPDHVIRCDL